MSYLIKKKIGARTLYYKWFSTTAPSDRPIMVSRKMAARFDKGTAGTVCRHLNTLAGGGFEVIDEDMVDERVK